MRSTGGDSQPRRPESPHVRRMVAAADMSAVCQVIGAAFADNPSTLANLGGDTARAEQVMRLRSGLSQWRTGHGAGK